MGEEDYKAVGAIKNQWIETKDEYLDMALNVIDNLKIKNKQLKEVINEVREYVKSHFKEMVADEEAQKLLEILDKVGDDNEQ